MANKKKVDFSLLCKTGAIERHQNNDPNQFNYRDFALKILIVVCMIVLCLLWLYQISIVII